ncbi:MFS transporter [Streptomyces sp. EAS-AB2608]|uniref:MFS transporter n=1 Tax=Streptomyces sp. EAS-AB2608 TaxID=2779671 RepID=UPI00288C29A5|nr:MFS transporter [Streptomyces sp. EAS-AB2608]
MAAVTVPSNPASPPGRTARPNLLDRVGIPKALSWGFLGVLIFMIGDGVESGFLSPYLISEGISKERVALLFTVYGVTASISAWFSGALSDLWGPRRVMLLGFGIWAALQVVLLGLALPAHHYWLIMVSYGLRGFGYPLFAYGFLVWVTAVTPRHRLGSAVGWFWFAFTGGLPTLGSLVASFTVPWLGTYRTLWFSLVLVAAGALIALLLVREPVGRSRLAPAGERPVATLLGSLSIVWRNPRIGTGAVVRTINTAAQFGFLVFLPVFFTDTLGFSLTDWLRLLSAMFATNIFFNLLFGLVGDRLGWQRTVAWFGGVGCAVTTLLLYYGTVASGDNFVLAMVLVSLFGATLAGYVPLSALMPSLAPDHKGQAMSALNLGAGASTFVGPAVVGLFLGPLGVQGVMWIFAGLYLASAAMTLFLTLPEPAAPPRDTTAVPARGRAESVSGPERV